MEIIDNYRAMSAERVGGKFACQARLRAEAVPVPEFFCLSRHLFDRLVESRRAEIAAILAELKLSDRAGIAAAAREIAGLITAIELDGRTSAAILKAYDKHHARAGFVSVRACMVCDKTEFSEDSVSNPFAGISESFLYVTREQVLARVKQCWASAYAEKAIVYRLSQGIDLADVSVAVGIQRMIFGARSFVMFSADPNSAAHDTLIVAGYGIGEGVVQESVPVDHYFINGKTGELRSVIADKDSRLSVDARSGSGLSRFPVAAELRQAPCLGEAELRELAALGKRIEKAFGWPQDMEGCFTEQGELFLLQARPVAIDYKQKRVWTGLNVTESYPGISSPLTYSLARLFYRVIFRDLYKLLGVDESTLHRSHALLDRMIGYVRGRVYYSLNAFYLLHQQSPLFPRLAPFWEEMVGLKTSYVIHSGEAETAAGPLRKKLAVAGATLKVAAMFLRHPRKMRQYKHWWIKRVAASRALIQSRPGPLALTEEFHRLWRDVGEKWGVTLVNDAYIFTLYGLTQLLMKRWKLEPSLLSNLLCGGEEIESVEIFLSILRIAEQVRGDEAARALFLGRDEAALVAAFRAGELPETTTALLTRHIELYGDRSIEELKMESPSLREDPSVLLGGIRRFVKSELASESFGEAEQAKRAEAEAELQRHFGRLSLRKPVLRWLLSHLREVVAHRENSRYCRSELFGLCKDIFRAQGEYLAGKGAIARAEDVYCLTTQEIFGYVDGTGVDEGFHATVSRRRLQLAEYAAEQIPDTLTTDGGLRDNLMVRQPEAVEGDGRELRGLGSSMGIVAGTARVVLDPGSIDELAPNTILVARETDPGWLFLMLASKGMVVERGSMLSHTAITGRKFGIPTIVGVIDATSRIPDGAAVEIDGGRGVVKLLGEEAA